MQLKYRKWGSEGPYALLLHGITSNAQAWWRVAPRLVELGYRVVAFDMPGHGNSRETTDHRIESVAESIAEAAADLGIDRMLLIGHSWGGSVALAMAARWPERVSRLVLIDPALSLTAEIGKTRIATFTKGIGSPAETLAPAIAQANPDWHEEDVRWKAEAMQQCRAEAVVGFFTQSGDWNLTPSLAELKVPVLLLVADPSATVIDAATRGVAQRQLDREGARMTIIPNTSHNMYRGAGYEPTMAAISDWLAGK
ncbi:MAG TPA: alpha/beta hydrolase [Burkholderiales bacterium]|nr:alpha/beta hydrolase [Burkholderiales bacterium]